MKNRKKLISGCLLGIVGIACLRYIVKNEKDKKYPVERYWDEQEEKQQNTSGDDTQTDCDAEEKDVTHSVTIDNITYEFVDCDMIEDTEIEMQTRYPAEFFIDSALPDANYQTDLLWDYEKMYEEKRKYHMRKKSAGLENKVQHYVPAICPITGCNGTRKENIIIIKRVADWCKSGFAARFYIYGYRQGCSRFQDNK